MFLKKLLTKLHLRYEDPEEEKEYAEVKKPLLRNFVQIVLAVLIGILIPYTVRYFDKELFPQSYIFVILIVVGTFFYLIKSKFEGCLDWLLICFLIAVVAVFATAFRDLLVGENARECFYMGYAFAMIHRLIGYGVIKFQHMVLLHICSIAIKFPMIPNPDILLNIIVILLDILTVGLSYKSEGLERQMFDSLYKSKKDIEQFKHLLTAYLPNQMAIISTETTDVCYLNNSFKKTFKCQNAHQFKETAEKLKIERETLEKNNKLFNSLGFFDEAKEETPLTLSTFLTLVSHNPDTLKQFKNVSFPVIEDLPKMDLSLQVLEHNHPHIQISNGGTVTKDATDLKGQKNSSSAIGRREHSDGRKDGTMEVNDTVKSSDKGSQEKGSKGSSSDIVYEEGRKRVFKVKVFSLLWDEKEAIAIVLDDITQQRIIMELKIADKNKDLVIAMVSHELRTPLNGMLGLIDIAKKNITQPDTLSYLSACRNSGVLLLNLVNSILDLNQINYKKLRLVYTKFSLHDLFDEIRSLFAYNCKLKMLYLETIISSEVPDIIKLDKSRLSQVLINLLGNAFKFTFNGGVTLRVDLECQSPLRLKFSVLDTGIGISKEDQDKLFKMYGRLEQQDKKINTHGVGLGLTISNTLAALLNPTEKLGIHVDSEVNKGTCFSFIVEPNIGEKSKRRDVESGSMEDLSSNGFNEDRDTTIMKKVTVYTINNNENYTKMTSSSQAELLNPDPRKAARTSVELMLSSQNPSPKGNRFRVREETGREDDIYKRISSKEMIDERSEENIEQEFNIEQNARNQKPWCLVVDDNPFNLMVACHIMEEKGFRVKTALNGQEAINRADEHQKSGEAFFIILMDCQMPVMDGYQATRVLREMMKYNKLAECPIVALTANNRDEEHDKLCEESGMSGHVAKPLQIKELDSVLKQAAKKRS